MTYIIIAVLLLAAELIYFRIADKCNIIDKPNERSSHSTIQVVELTLNNCFLMSKMRKEEVLPPLFPRFCCTPFLNCSLRFLYGRGLCAIV